MKKLWITNKWETPTLYSSHENTLLLKNFITCKASICKYRSWRTLHYFQSQIYAIQDGRCYSTMRTTFISTMVLKSWEASKTERMDYTFLSMIKKQEHNLQSKTCGQQHVSQFNICRDTTISPSMPFSNNNWHIMQGNQKRAAYWFPPDDLDTSLQALAWIHCYSERPHELNTKGTTIKPDAGDEGNQAIKYDFMHSIIQHTQFELFVWAKIVEESNSIYTYKWAISTPISSRKMMHDGGLWVQKQCNSSVHFKGSSRKKSQCFLWPKTKCPRQTMSKRLKESIINERNTKI